MLNSFRSIHPICRPAVRFLLPVLLVLSYYGVVESSSFAAEQSDTNGMNTADRVRRPKGGNANEVPPAAPTTLSKEQGKDRLERLRFQAILNLTKAHEKTLNRKFAELAWSDTLLEAERLFGLKSKDYRDVLHSFAAFYARNLEYAKAEQLYKSDLQRYFPEHGSAQSASSPRLDNDCAILVEDDMCGLAALLEKSGMASEAQKWRTKAKVIRDGRCSTVEKPKSP